MIPVIDIFAGPGGLGEGFNALRAGRRQIFKTVLSIEKDKAARETLRLRSFFRQFEDRVPQAYYEFVRGALSLEELYLRYPDEVAKADEEAWLAELGNPEEYPTSEIDERIDKALRGAENWVLIGGPPCQAYSVVGRSRMAHEPEKYQEDPRHFLYREYLRIIANHRPPVFEMENVKGILSSKVEGSLIINRILADLKQPCDANSTHRTFRSTKGTSYKLYSFANYEGNGKLFEEMEIDPADYVIRCERHDNPQARHEAVRRRWRPGNGRRFRCRWGRPRRRAGSF